jgi:tetratricopeptide (TPR) repeat protein
MKNVMMTFCIIVTLVFIWVWHHQTQFNDHSRQAFFHIKNGELDDAIEAYTKAIRYKKRAVLLPEEPSAYNNLALAYLRNADYDQAIETFKTVIEMKPDAVQAYVNLATVYLKQNRADLAIATCQDALRIAPNSALARYNLACAYALTGQNEQAIDSLKRAIEGNAGVKALIHEENAFDKLRTHPQFPSE